MVSSQAVAVFSMSWKLQPPGLCGGEAFRGSVGGDPRRVLMTLEEERGGDWVPAACSALPCHALCPVMVPQGSLQKTLPHIPGRPSLQNWEPSKLLHRRPRHTHQTQPDAPPENRERKNTHTHTQVDKKYQNKSARVCKSGV